MKIFASLFYSAAICIQSDLSDHDDDLRTSHWNVASANDGSQPCCKLANLKGFCDIVRCATIQSLNDVIFFVAHGEHHDRKMRIALADSAACFFAAHSRHIDVE